LRATSSAWVILARRVRPFLASTTTICKISVVP
jgi:hypothetical protein